MPTVGTVLSSLFWKNPEALTQVASAEVLNDPHEAANLATAAAVYAFNIHTTRMEFRGNVPEEIFTAARQLRCLVARGQLTQPGLFEMLHRLQALQSEIPKERHRATASTAIRSGRVVFSPPSRQRFDLQLVNAFFSGSYALKGMQNHPALNDREAVRNLLTALGVFALFGSKDADYSPGFLGGDYTAEVFWRETDYWRLYVDYPEPTLERTTNPRDEYERQLAQQLTMIIDHMEVCERVIDFLSDRMEVIKAGGAAVFGKPPLTEKGLPDVSDSLAAFLSFERLVSNTHLLELVRMGGKQAPLALAHLRRRAANGDKEAGSFITSAN